MRWENPAVDFVDRWRPFGLVAGVLLAGLLLGILVGLFACGASDSLTGAKEERYYVLAGKLYSQGESLDAMKVYLTAAGSGDVSSNVLRLAEKYERSADDSGVAEARDLRQLGEALRSAPALLSSLGKVPLPSVVPLGSQPSSTVEARPVATPTTSLVPAPTPIPPTPTPTPAPSTTVVTGKGVARPAGGGGVVLREQPSTKSNWVASIPTGGKVDVLKVLDGEAVDPAEPRWYQVKYGERTGYVYFKLIAQGE